MVSARRGSGVHIGYTAIGLVRVWEEHSCPAGVDGQGRAFQKCAGVCEHLAAASALRS